MDTTGERLHNAVHGAAMAREKVVHRDRVLRARCKQQVAYGANKVGYAIDVSVH
jgi:hypothetical protein